jgi:hypothetical protein
MDHSGIVMDRPLLPMPRGPVPGGRAKGAHTNLLVGLVLSVILAGQGASVLWAAPQVSEEYQIKAAFMYNFIKFVEWPKDRFAGDKDPIVIGVVGKDPFGEVLDQIADKPVKDRKIVVKRFAPVAAEDADPIHPQLDAIRQSHVLFVCPSEKKVCKRLLAAIGDAAVLTVGDGPSFLDEGGMINLLVEERKVRFEISLVKARSAKLDISSQLLRLAKRVDEGK